MNETKSRDWKRWVLVGIVGLMLLTMGMYMASMDEAEPDAVIDRVSAPNE